MCGIIGFCSNNVTKKDLKVLKKVMIESRIRGKHASGIAWYNGKSIDYDVKPISIDNLVEEFDFNKLIYDGTNVSLVAHARYSTSDIKYNQPLIGKRYAIAHNGVITQSSPDTWESLYGYKCKTKNDSELLLKSLENGDNVFDKFPDSSIACVAIDNKGNLIYFRNSIRPMWMGMIGDGRIYASTFDILNRAGVTGITKISPSDYKESQNRSKK